MTLASPVQVAAAAVALVLICVGVLTIAGVRVRADALVAAARAAVQLAGVALVIAWVFTHPAGAWGYLTVMLALAAVTSQRRIGLAAPAWPSLVLAIGTGAAAAVIPVVLSGALPRQSTTLLPFTAQIIGGSMTAASLAGGRMRDDVRSTWPEVEAWLAIGATPRQAVAGHARLAVARALVPALDQTRSAGLVVLPGAFVGLLLGGATPWQAAQVQTLVLVGLLAAETVTAVLTVRMLATTFGTHRPESPPRGP